MLSGKNKQSFWKPNLLYDPQGVKIITELSLCILLYMCTCYPQFPRNDFKMHSRRSSTTFSTRENAPYLQCVHLCCKTPIKSVSVSKD